MHQLKELVALEKRLKDAKNGWRKSSDLLRALQDVTIDTKQQKTEIYAILKEKIRTLRYDNQEEGFRSIKDTVKVLEGTPEGRGIQLQRGGDDIYITLQKVFANYRDYVLIQKDQRYPAGDQKRRELHKRVIQGVKLDYTKIPPNFWIRHNITPADGPQAIKEIFAQSEKLGYIDDTYKFTSRILYTQEGTILSRRTNKKLMKFINPTAAEKKKYELQHLLNTYTDEFAAVRAQKYIINKARTGADFYKGVKISLTQIMNQILRAAITKEQAAVGDDKVLGDIADIKDKLSEATLALENATNYETTRAVTRMLSKRTVPNNKLYMRLYGAENDMSKRIAELNHMFIHIELQTGGMEHRLENNKSGMDRLWTTLFERKSRKTTPDKQRQYIENMVQSREVKFPKGNISHPWKGYIDQLQEAHTVDGVRFKSLIALQKLHAQTYERQENIAHGTGELILDCDQRQLAFDEILQLSSQFEQLQHAKENNQSYQEQKKIIEKIRKDIQDYCEVIIGSSWNIG